MRRHFAYLRSFGRAIWRHHVELTVVLALVFIISLVGAATAYWAEAGAGTFTSFWVAFYWSVTTVTTVGYGDIVPATTPGQIISVVLSLLGAGFLVLTAGILAASFVEEMSQHKRNQD